jgi:heptaprenyl diphosphate synthase
MQSLNSPDGNAAVKKTVWLLCAVAINALEFFIPRLPFFPWLKPGLANIVTVLWIVEFGAVDAVLYSLLRTWIVGFYFGFSFLTIALAMSGGLCATIAMGIFWHYLGKNNLLGTIGLGIIGALFHNMGQLFAVYWLMAANLHLFYQVPIMLIASVAFGGVVGACAPVAYKAFGNSGQPPFGTDRHIPAFSATAKDRVFSVVLLAGCFGIVFAGSYTALLASAVGASVIVQVQLKGSFKAFVKPITSFWALFIFIACIDLFFSYGTRMERLPWFTHEGVDLTLKQWLRLWTWLQGMYILTHFNFHAVMLSALSRIFRSHHETLFAGVLALEFFPAIAEESKAYVKKRFALLFSADKRAKTDKGKKRNVQDWINAWAEGLYGMVLSKIKDK